jgi:hypothetical protein
LVPHDCKGNEVKPGDRVVLRGVVRDVFPSESACNVNVDIDNGNEPYKPFLTLNTQGVEVIGLGNGEDKDIRNEVLKNLP